MRGDRRRTCTKLRTSGLSSSRRQQAEISLPASVPAIARNATDGGAIFSKDEGRISVPAARDETDERLEIGDLGNLLIAFGVKPCSRQVE